MSGIAAVIPAYQAAHSVGAVVRGTRERIDHVLVVDDGSTDGTGAAAAQAGARVIGFDRNRGKGCALRAGFDDLFCRGYDGVVSLDADGQHLPSELPRLIAAYAGGADLVIGSRDHLFGGMGAVRRTSNRWSSYLISAVAGQVLSDVQSGFRLYGRRLIAEAGFPDGRFEAESAIVVRAVRRGFTIVTTPVELGFADGRSTSHYRPVLDSLRILGAVARARWEMVGCTQTRSS